MPDLDERRLDQVDWVGLVAELKAGDLVPFLGAGASLSTNGGPGLPSGSELAEILAEECGFPGAEKTDLARVSQFYALRRGQTRLREAVVARLSPADGERPTPGDVHSILARWPIKYVLSTNYDSFMEDAFAERRKNAISLIYERGGNQEQIREVPDVDQPLVYKLHGSLENQASLVLTEDDMIDFLISLIRGNPSVPDKIRSLFTTSSILFLGYGLKDWNIRVLLRYLREEAKADIRSYVVQQVELDEDDDMAIREWDSVVLYWERQSVSVFNCDALTFLQRLDREYQQENDE